MVFLKKVSTNSQETTLSNEFHSSLSSESLSETLFYEHIRKVGIQF